MVFSDVLLELGDEGGLNNSLAARGAAVVLGLNLLSTAVASSGGSNKLVVSELEVLNSTGGNGENLLDLSEGSAVLLLVDLPGTFFFTNSLLDLPVGGFSLNINLSSVGVDDVSVLVPKELEFVVGVSVFVATLDVTGGKSGLFSLDIKSISSRKKKHS